MTNLPLRSELVEEGITIEIRQNPFAGYNGYVILPKNHPWLTVPEEIRRAEYHREWYGPDDIRVHGGVTYFDADARRIGFDANHAGDWWPPEMQWVALEHPEIAHIIVDDKPDACDTVWSLEKIVEETKSLAHQAAAAMIDHV